MPLFRFTGDGLHQVPRTSLPSEQIQERRDLQAAIRQRLDVLGDDLMLIAEEYGSFTESRRRIDLLALDRTGTLVVIELKRTEDGGHLELQALRYAAMVSTMTPEHLLATYADTHDVELDEASQEIESWVGGPLDALPDHVRIILVSADFRTEITSTVIWLNQNYNTDISCYRIVSYRLGQEVLLDLQQIIPLPEAKDFQIQQRQKGVAVAAAKSGKDGRDHTKYNLVLGAQSFPRMSKQAAVKAAVQHLFRSGVDVDSIRAAALGHRWVSVHPAADEAVDVAFRREFPYRSDGHLWFDLGITSGNATWVMPRFGGRDTEDILQGLQAVAGPRTVLEWSRAE